MPKDAETLLTEYIDSKSDSGADKVKKQFFTELRALLQNNQLTAASLTDKIASLEDTAREDLFYLGRSRQASENSKAAQIIKTLYGLLNVRLSDKGMATIVQRKISLEDQKVLKGQRYKNWLSNPVAARETQDLNHELKGLLQLNSNDNRGKSLAEVLYLSWKTKSVFDEAQLGDNEKNQLGIILQQAPDYLPQLLHGMYALCNEEDKPSFRQQLLTLAENEEAFKPYVLDASVDFAAQWMKESPATDDIAGDYFQLSAPMQQALRLRLQDDRGVGLRLAIAAREALFSLPSHAKKEALDESQQDSVLSILTAEKAGSEAIDKSSPAYKHVLSLITDKKHEDQFKEALAQDMRLEAISYINAYLREKDPSGYKYQFFDQLRRDIDKKGLTLELMEEHRKKLAKDKQRFPITERAGQLMEKLQTSARESSTLEKEGLNEAVFRDYAETVFSGKKQPQTWLDDAILSVIRNLQSIAQLLLYKNRGLKQRLEAEYQRYIREKALELAEEQEHPVFDPQGHVLVFLTLKESDYQAILEKFDIEVEGSARKRLEEIIGPVTKTTFCNLDVVDSEPLKRKFQDWTDSETFFEDFKDDRGSIIALQEEMAEHVLLSLRVLEKKLDLQNIDESFKQDLLVELNAKIREVFQSALKKCDEAKPEDKAALLNKIIDDERKELAKAGRELLVARLFNEVEDQEAIEEKLAELKDHDFTSVTATGLDYLRNDVRNQTIVRITATENTAHDKKAGQQAIRLLHRNRYKEGQVSAYAAATYEARVPSIAVKEISHQPAVKDVAAKLGETRKRMQNMQPDYQGPLIYNLLTSLHGKAKDRFLGEAKNRQRKSAARIFKGAHLYNRQQMQAGNFQNFTFVQNIPVNQHGGGLDETDFDDAIKEATLMTNMSMLATFRHHSALFSPLLQKSLEDSYQRSQKLYRGFLPSADGSRYFHPSWQGKELAKMLKAKKAAWLENKAVSAAENLNDIVVQALFKLYCQNDHYNKQFGMLIQALSIFVEPMSQAGCKSANERYQAVAGRVELLKSLSLRPEEEQSDLEKQLVAELKRFAVEGGSCEKLQQCMDLAYNAHNLQGAAASFSEEDQGASSKVKASKNKEKAGVISEIDTNVAETSYLTRLSQKNSSSMQTHKAKLAGKYTELFKAKISEQQSATSHGM